MFLKFITNDFQYIKYRLVKYVGILKGTKLCNQLYKMESRLHNRLNVKNLA